LEKILIAIPIKALIKSACLLVGLGFAHPLFALEYECNTGNDKRFIRLELPGIEHLCEVTVTYSSDERKVMWYADHDSLFCSDKTEDLKEKYVSVWNFECEQWPDHDGVDQLSKRQRIILDAELKALIVKGQDELAPFVVEGLKAAASPSTGNDGDDELLVVQFFLHEPDTDVTRDVTHIIRDNGDKWTTQAKIDTLANYIDTDEGYIVNSALISNVTGTGAMEIITVLDANQTLKNDNGASNFAGCYGNQTLAAESDGELIAKTPHRYYCPETIGADAG